MIVVTDKDLKSIESGIHIRGSVEDILNEFTTIVVSIRKMYMDKDNNSMLRAIDNCMSIMLKDVIKCSTIEELDNPFGEDTINAVMCELTTAAGKTVCEAGAKIKANSDSIDSIMDKLDKLQADINRFADELELKEGDNND